MTNFPSTNPPATLRQWLLQSLLWMMLSFGLVVAGWAACLMAGGREQRGEAGWVVLLLLTHFGTTALLGGQVRAFNALYDETARRSSWYLKLAAQIWSVLLLLLTWLWLLIDCVLLLFGLLILANRDTPHQPWF